MDCESDEAEYRQRGTGGCKCLSATAHLGLTFRKDSKLEDVQLEYDLETYVDADYAHKADDGRSVSGVPVCRGGTLVSWFSRT